MSFIERTLIDLAKACNQVFGSPGCAHLLGGFASPLMGVLAGTFPYLRNSLLGREGKR